MMKERDSNIELLRIIATLFILIVHCNGWFLREWGGITGWNTGSIAVAMSRILIQNISCLGVDLFILISGFYGIRPKLKSIVNLFTLLVFFYVGCYLLNCCVVHESFSIRRLFDNALAFSHTNWYINSYLFLMLLSPMVNAFIDAADTRKLGWYALAFCLITLYFGQLRDNAYWFYNQGYSVIVMLGIYLVGRFLNRMKETLSNIKYRHLLISFVGMLGLMTMVRVLSSNDEAWLHYGSPITIIAACIFFTIFYRLPKFHSKAINWIGASCLAAFIFHTCAPIVSWLAETDVRIFTSDVYPVYCLKMGAMIIGVFMVAILLDKIRLLLFKPLIKWSGKVQSLN